MKKTVAIFFFCVLPMLSFAQQKYTVEKSLVTFFSDGLIEDITALNPKATSIYDASKGDIAFLIKIKDFEFEKKLMQVHFNEKFLESEKYPKSTFIGVVNGYSSSKQGKQNVTATGKLSIHGVTKEVTIPGTIENTGSNLLLKSKFMVRLADYNVTIPQIVWQNISEVVEVTLDFVYVPL